ncbi:MAG: tetratricopeptide repeat protein [Bacteroidota bacterium]
MVLFKNKATGALIVIMIALVISGLFIAKKYYGSVNRAVDPRIVPARELYAKYDNYAREGDYHKIFALLDSVESVYKDYPHYENSFELGVIHNNRAAAYITIFLFGDSIRADYNPFSEIDPDSLLNMAEAEVNKAISLYEGWLEKYGASSSEDIREMIDDDFKRKMPAQDPAILEKFLEARAEEIIRAVEETDRRLSVCYTNLGVIKRQRGEYEQAVRCYEKALGLWDRNLSAENNMNILLGKPLKKRNIIQKMFPPEK